MIGQALLWGGIALAASPVVAWLFLVWWRHPAVAYAFGIAISLFSLTQLGTPALRFAVILPLFPHIAYAIIDAARSPRSTMPSPTVPIIYTATCALSILWSQLPHETLAGVAAWGIVLTFILSFRQIMPERDIKKITLGVLLGFVAASVPFLATSNGWWAGRARGIFYNANSLGIVCLLALAISMWYGYKLWIPLAIPLLGIMTLTASRASFLSAIVAIVVATIPRMKPAYKFTLIAFATISAYPAFRWATAQIVSLDASEDSLLRTNNSRDTTWSAILDVIDKNPLIGVGYDAGPPMIANSYLKLVAEFGIIASAAGVALVISYLVWARADTTLFAFALAGCVNGIFEDWLLTAGAPYLLIFLMILMSSPKIASPPNNDSNGKTKRISKTHESHAVPCRSPKVGAIG